MNSKQYMREWARRYRASDRYLSNRLSIKRLLLKKPTDGFSMSGLLWAAGFLEGEGSFHFSNQSHLLVRATQVQREPLDRLVILFGGKVSEVIRKDGKRGKNGVWSDFYDWNVYGQRAAGVCMTLYSLMSPKRKGQIKEALVKWRLRPGRAGRPRGKS